MRFLFLLWIAVSSCIGQDTISNHTNFPVQVYKPSGWSVYVQAGETASVCIPSNVPLSTLTCKMFVPDGTNWTTVSAAAAEFEVDGSFVSLSGFSNPEPSIGRFHFDVVPDDAAGLSPSASSGNGPRLQMSQIVEGERVVFTAAGGGGQTATAPESSGEKLDGIKTASAAVPAGLGLCGGLFTILFLWLRRR